MYKLKPTTDILSQYDSYLSATVLKYFEYLFVSVEKIIRQCINQISKLFLQIFKKGFF